MKPGNPDELDPPELLASKLIDAWCDSHGGLIAWNKAVAITALICKMPDEKRARLQLMDDDEPSQAMRDVCAERWAQVTREGYSHEHDDGHAGGDIVEAAICYAQGFYTWHRISTQQRWPWEMAVWKPKDRRRNLVRAAALLVAELERMDRTTKPEEPTA